MMNISYVLFMRITISLLKCIELQTLQRWFRLCKLHVNTIINVAFFFVILQPNRFVSKLAHSLPSPHSLSPNTHQARLSIPSETLKTKFSFTLRFCPTLDVGYTLLSLGDLGGESYWGAIYAWTSRGQGV